MKDVLDRVTDHFDFTWRINSRGAILMNKRFHNPEERPQAHLAEMQHMAKDALTAFGSLKFDPYPSHDTSLRNDLYRSLTPQQHSALLAGLHLKVENLSPEQAESLNQAILNHAAAPLYSRWELLSSQLFGIPTGSLYTEMTQYKSARPGSLNQSSYTVRFLYTDRNGNDHPSIVISQPVSKTN